MAIIDPKFANAKFQMGDVVFKWTGDYTGPGIVRGLSLNAKGQIRYLVGHQVRDGDGEFLHVYAEGNLRDAELLNDLPTITKEEGLASRTGQATPNDITLLPKPRAQKELVEALATAHRQVDMLMAMVITMDKSFMPSESPLWPDLVARVELIRKYEGTL